MLVYALGNVIGGFLFGVEAHDAGTVGLAALVLGSAALLAAAIPTLQAAQADPMTVLRSE